MTLLAAAGLARGATAPGTEARAVWLHLPNMFDADPAKGKEQVHSTVQKLAEHNFNLVLPWVTSDYLVALDDPEYQKKIAMRVGIPWAFRSTAAVVPPWSLPKNIRLFRPTATPRIARSVALLSISRSPSSQ